MYKLTILTASYIMVIIYSTEKNWVYESLRGGSFSKLENFPKN